ncbi:MAG: hypothetical protein ACI4D7_10450 [Lachnospiraceae bacterium]
MKHTIVINGAGGVGKDTLCEFAKKKYKTMNVSSVDPIKEAAYILGWDGQKRLEDRKFLSDLKRLVSQYNDFSTKYLVDQYKKFIAGDDDLLFVHIREGEEINHFKESIDGKIITLLIRRDIGDHQYGNISDDEVELYNYDYIYDNNLPLDKAENDFIGFLTSIINENNM